MENLKSHTVVQEFLSRYPEKIHNTCILGLCLLAIDLINSTKINFSKYLSEKFSPSPLLPLNKKLADLRQELSLLNNSLPSVSLPKSNLSESIEKDLEKYESEGENEGNLIEIVDSFLNKTLIKEIYQKEIIAERLRVPFRKKWDDACKNIERRRENN